MDFAVAYGKTVHLAVVVRVHNENSFALQCRDEHGHYSCFQHSIYHLQLAVLLKIIQNQSPKRASASWSGIAGCDNNGSHQLNEW